MNPIRASLKTPQVSLAILLIVFVAGIWALLHMPRREDPKVEVTSALVVAMYPGAKAEEVEAQVTNKLEQRLFQFAEVRKAKTHSTTRDGLV
ncbi:MAG TPA: efflux RND transporter permease subunit, partial [Fibrobacteria bacterium]|nr:efflux RND transporter permease subunit [Fibrobacteria bacterium]